MCEGPDHWGQCHPWGSAPALHKESRVSKSWEQASEHITWWSLLQFLSLCSYLSFCPPFPQGWNVACPCKPNEPLPLRVSFGQWFITAAEKPNLDHLCSFLTVLHFGCDCGYQTASINTHETVHFKRANSLGRSYTCLFLSLIVQLTVTHWACAQWY